MPQMLAEIVRGVLDAEADMHVVGPFPRRLDSLSIIDLIDDWEPDAVVLGHDNATLPGLAEAILARHPSPIVVSIASDGHQGWIHRMVQTCESVTGLSPENLVQGLRSQMRTSPEP